MANTRPNRPKSSAAPNKSSQSKSAAGRARAAAAEPSEAAPRLATAERSVPAETPAVSPGNPPPPSASTPAGTGAAQPATGPQRKRFDIFIADIGWNSPVADAVRKNIDHCLRFQANSTTYLLSKEQCAELFRMHPAMIGTEPSIFFIDREAYNANRARGFGFKLNLGLIRDVPTANNLLKWIMAVIAEQKPGSDITEPIRTVIHKEGIRGAIDILADIAHSPVGETVTH